MKVTPAYIAQAEEVLSFWFADAPTSPEAAKNASRRWFTRDAAFDALLTARFAGLPRRASEGELDDWTFEPRCALARTLVLDQFPRNLYRDDRRSFAYDELAQQAAAQAVDAGFDRAVGAIEAVFFYLPFEHAENRAMQERSVLAFAALCDRAPPGCADLFAGFLDYARRHRNVIARFGRFPHRNEVLGRQCTPEETAWLGSDGERFGPRPGR